MALKKISIRVKSDLDVIRVDSRTFYVPILSYYLFKLLIRVISKIF